VWRGKKVSKMSIIFREARVQVFTSPKVLSTSLKHLAFELENGYEFQPFSVFGRTIHIHHLMPAKTFNKTTPLEGFTRIAFIRAPIPRFVSMYANRVLRKHKASLHGWEEAEKRGLPLLPKIDFLVSHLEQYRDAVMEIRHHSAPQANFLGSNPDFFDAIFTPETVSDFENLLSMRLGQKITLPHKQSSPVSKKIKVSRRSASALEAFYSEDVGLFAQATHSKSRRDEQPPGVT